MPRRSSSRARTIEATAELLQRRGYAATSLDDIVGLSGAPKGSLYFHFPGGKEQIAAEALAASGQQVLGALTTLAGRSDGPGELVRRLAAAQAAQLAGSAYELGCPVATVALEMASRSDTIQAAVQDAFDAWAGALAAVLAEGGVAEDRAHHLARWAVAALEGGLLLARAARDAEVVTTLAETTAAVLDEAVAEARSDPPSTSPEAPDGSRQPS